MTAVVHFYDKGDPRTSACGLSWHGPFATIPAEVTCKQCMRRMERDTKGTQGQQILQIVPAPSGIVAMLDDGGEEASREPVVAFGLVDRGGRRVAIAMVVDGASGQLECVDTLRNFLGVNHRRRVQHVSSGRTDD